MLSGDSQNPDPPVASPKIQVASSKIPDCFLKNSTPQKFRFGAWGEMDSLEGFLTHNGGDVTGGRCKATWKREFKLPWCEAGPPDHLNDKVDSDQ